MTDQLVEGRSSRRFALIALGLALVLLMTVGVPAAEADTVGMACGGSTEYLTYSSLNFYLPFDGGVVQFAHSVGGGAYKYSDWHYSSPNRSLARWNGYEWLWGWGNADLSDWTAQGQKVVGWVRYLDNPSVWYPLGECGGGEIWTAGEYAGW
ncbi:MAG TPA: hypothetical protein VM848_12210 [Acidimicrobiia bacterium]|nr:hypothetical protein [Acidimicrobiia bacterium]